MHVTKAQRFFVGFLSVTLSLLIVGCGCSSKDAEANKPSAAEEAEADARFAGYDNDYLRISIAEGWTANPDGDEDAHRSDERGGYHALSVEHGDRLNLGSFGYLRVAVYDVETVEGAGEVPEERENYENILEVDPIEVAGERLSGYSADGKTVSGDASFQYRCYGGTINGHYVEVSFVDYTGGSLIEGEDMLAMAQTIEVK